MPISKSRLPLILLLLAIVVVGGLIWYTVNRLTDLDRQLETSERRAEEINRGLRDYSEDLEVAIERARATRQRAAEAEESAEQEKSAREQAEEQAATAETERERAQAETRQSKEELARIRTRRQQELDRMQQALNKIAPTRRTPAGMVMMLSDEHFGFDFDKATLRPANKEKLSRIAGILLASEGYRLFIDGHTDDVGSADYNQTLSERRAAAVRDYLVQAGIPKEVIEAQGFGKEQPLKAAATKEARALNRRVEIGIVDTIVRYQGQVKN